MSLKQTSNIVSNLQSKRDTKTGFNLSATQSTYLPNGLRHELLIIPSTSAPAFGSTFIFDIKEKNILLNDLMIQLNVGAGSGLTGGSANRWLPAYLWMTKIEIIQNNTTIDTLYPHQQYIMNNLLYEDEDRVLRNNLCGNYASTAQRTTLLSSASNFFINLHSLFNQCNLPLLTENHAIQLRITLDSLANLYSFSSAPTGTLAATINYANIVAKITRLDPSTAQNRLVAMRTRPEHHLFHQLRYSPFNISSGVSNSTTILTPFVGNVAFLFFVCRYTNQLTGTSDQAFKYNSNISNFQILGADGASIVGGQPIPYQVALQYLGQYFSRSSFTSETSIGTNLAGTIVDNGANVVCWSFSADPMEALTYGKALGSRRFIGSEQLQITYTAALSNAVQLDVYALCETVLEMSPTLIRVMPL